MKCHYCQEPCDSQYHHDCWKAMHAAADRRRWQLRDEANAAVKAINEGRQVIVSEPCMAAHGDDIAEARRIASSGKRSGRKVEL